MVFWGILQGKQQFEILKHNICILKQAMMALQECGKTECKFVPYNKHGFFKLADCIFKLFLMILKLMICTLWYIVNVCFWIKCVQNTLKRIFSQDERNSLTKCSNRGWDWTAFQFAWENLLIQICPMQGLNSHLSDHNLGCYQLSCNI